MATIPTLMRANPTLHPSGLPPTGWGSTQQLLGPGGFPGRLQSAHGAGCQVWLVSPKADQANLNTNPCSINSLAVVLRLLS